MRIRRRGTMGVAVFVELNQNLAESLGPAYFAASGLAFQNLKRTRR